MNGGIFGPQDASGSPANLQTFVETLSSSSATQQSWNISPRPGVVRHYIVMQSPQSPQSGYGRVLLNGSFPDGYSIVFIFDFTATTAPYIEVLAEGSLVYATPRQPSRDTGETAEIVRVGGSWRRVAVHQESRYGNQLLSAVASSMNARGLFPGQSSVSNSGNVNNNGVTAVGTVANSTAYRHGQLTTVPMASRTTQRHIFAVPFAMQINLDPNYSVAGLTPSVTATLRAGVIGMFQNISADGTPTVLAMGFQFNNVGVTSAFFHNGSTLTTTPIGYSLPDTGGGQGGMLLQLALYWNPAGVAEWYIAGRRYLRLENFSYSLPATAYPSYYISAATGASTGTGNVTLTHIDARYYAV